MVLESIDETTGYHALAARLLDLNRQGKLKEPLVGPLGATVHVYKACEDGKEIKESFMATLLPPPEGDSEEEEISGFGVELPDLLGDNVPNSHDPKNKVMFSLKELEKFGRTALPPATNQEGESICPGSEASYCSWAVGGEGNLSAK